MNFACTLKEQDSITILTPEGSLTERSQADEMVRQVDSMLSKGRNLFVLDLQAFEYMNSSGLGILINILTKTRSRDGEIVIIHVNKKIRELLIITKLITVFKVFENMEEAVEELSKQ